MPRAGCSFAGCPGTNLLPFCQHPGVGGALALCQAGSGIINYKMPLRWAGLLSPVLARSSLWGRQARGGVSSPGVLSARESHPVWRLEKVWT